MEQKKIKTPRNEQPWILAYILVLKIMNSPLSPFFWGLNQLVSLQNDVMEAKSQFNLSLILYHCSKALGPI